ncbi:hypothetical protein HOLleu_13207 [Holothuria leucospilota]|uniref:Uncharacterized protein n=1 Tax=Holothuria leucospilota TaxID=206669 RepID=A0A9Q1CCL3_HOLLE|nr:hypothetical protein HOLleu_13207 [Holothuria leucospilota]
MATLRCESICLLCVYLVPAVKQSTGQDSGCPTTVYLEKIKENQTGILEFDGRICNVEIQNTDLSNDSRSLEILFAITASLGFILWALTLFIICLRCFYKQKNCKREDKNRPHPPPPSGPAPNPANQRIQKTVNQTHGKHNPPSHSSSEPHKVRKYENGDSQPPTPNADSEGAQEADTTANPDSRSKLHPKLQMHEKEKQASYGLLSDNKYDQPPLLKESELNVSKRELLDLKEKIDALFLVGGGNEDNARENGGVAYYNTGIDRSTFQSEFKVEGLTSVNYF